MAKKEEQPVEAYDPIPETVDDALALWDSGAAVFSVEMGGIGPGYEQCIQVLAFELMRLWKSEDWTGEPNQEFSDRMRAAAEPITARVSKELGGMSGAQVGAAESLASCVLRRGYRNALRDPAVNDRQIQVSNRFPALSKP